VACYDKVPRILNLGDCGKEKTFLWRASQPIHNRERIDKFSIRERRLEREGNYSSPFNAKGMYEHVCQYALYCYGFDQRIARQRFRKHGPTRNSRTTELCNPFLGNGSVNTLPRRCNDVTTIVLSYQVTCVFCAFCATQQ
jgi:hypothetical protein